MIRLAFATLLLGTTVALAQAPNVGQAPDPQFMQSAIAALQQQRNEALDQAASLRGQLALTQQELQKAKSELAEAKAKVAPEPEKKK